MDGATGASLSRRFEAWVHLQPADGHGCVCGDRPGGAAGGGRGGVAVQPPRAGGAGESSRADPDAGELVGTVAGTGGHAESEWKPGEGGGEVLVDLEDRKSVV